MKLRNRVVLLVFIGLIWAALPVQVWAQSGTPEGGTPAGSPNEPPKGEVTGKIINRNDPSAEVGELEVMLHVLDQNQQSLGMLHGTSTPDGAFTIKDVPFEPGWGYAAAVVFDGTTYYSDLGLAEAGQTSLILEVPVYGSTPELTNVQIEEMHVIFNFAADGLEVKQLYGLSNLGDRTVKEGFEVPESDGKRATALFPLPENADFINFQPQSEGRFIKFSGGFAETASIVPGSMVDLFMVEYLVPYNKPLSFPFRADLPVQSVNFVIPQNAGVTLKAQGLGEPEPTTGNNGEQYYLYRLENIPAGTTLQVAFEGDLVLPSGQTTTTPVESPRPKNLPLFLGLGALGLVLAGGGGFMWFRSARQGGTVEIEGEDLAGDVREEDRPEFDALLVSIAELDRQFEQGDIEETDYREQRQNLITQAKALLSEENTGPDEPEPPSVGG